jgi:hypothetical protein
MKDWAIVGIDVDGQCTLSTGDAEEQQGRQYYSQAPNPKVSNEVGKPGVDEERAMGRFIARGAKGHKLSPVTERARRCGH